MDRKCKLVFLLPLSVLLFLVGVAHATEITGVIWDDYYNIILVSIDAWPGGWNDWTMYVDGVAMPVQEEGQELYVYPTDYPETSPTELAIGTRDSASEASLDGLTDVDFPCCGTLQFSIPGEGLTNIYEFSLSDFGCATASTTECPSGEWIVHDGDLIISGTETFLIEDAKYFQQGHIYVNDTATLTVRNSDLMIGRGDVPTVHVYIFVGPDATLILDNATVYPLPGGPPPGTLVCVMNEGDVWMTDSDTEIHYFDMAAGAQFAMTRSSMVNAIGGLLQVAGGSSLVTDSTLGALGLNVPAGAHLDATGLHSGVYFDSWDVHDMIPDADYDLVLVRTTILEDDFTGELEHGPYERGWVLFLDRDAHVRISDSELRKIFLETENDTAEFHDLRVDVPSSLTFRDIVLTDVVVTGEWSFTIWGGDVTFYNSDYLFLQPSQWAAVRLVDSHMVEFIPRNFAGTMVFENALWTVAGELVAGVGYHSMVNNFAMEGSLTMGPELRTNLVFHGAIVTRQLDVIATDVIGEPVEGLVIKTEGLWIDDNTGTYVTDEHGEATFNIKFCSLNYKQEVPGSIESTDPSPETPLVWEVWQSGDLIARQPLEFFLETPIRIEGLSASTPAVFRVTQEGNVLTDSAFYGTAFNSGSADVAEWVPVSELVEPGDVLELDPYNPNQYRKTRGPCSDLVAGVVSTDPGVILGAEPQTSDSGLPAPDRALLALLGIVPVKVTDEGGPIQPGDLLVTSSTPGHAMRWNSESGSLFCDFVGKALEPLTDERGVILVLLMLLATFRN